MKKLQPSSRGFGTKGLTLVELLMALAVTSVILTAVVTLAHALDTANDVSDDTSQKQAQVRYATLRISELIRHCKLICGAPGDDLCIWRADDNGDDKINPTELVYIESGTGRDFLQLLDFTWSASWNLTLFETQDINTKDALVMACDERRMLVVPECSNVRFAFDEAPPMSKLVSISFELYENGVTRQYQINASLRGWTGHLLNATADAIVSDDD
ncbi:MAG: prepilin-type N-terminal cleavage/methylation domain-containing protein [Planctomycetota bacterium]|nr:MAG: prepilin-type N-terminal cleavage/methylation domain-containing protein [Planctomycetota bacterium]